MTDSLPIAILLPADWKEQLERLSYDEECHYNLNIDDVYELILKWINE
jgi:hypothetical protein